jgi:hypothetical protein
MNQMNDTAIDWAIERIYEGDSQASIAKQLGVSAGHLSESLDAAYPTLTHPAAGSIRERSARARAASAEAWLDKGLQEVYDAIYDPSYKGSGRDSGAARAYAQECARRAAIRNPAYREKTGVEITGAKGGPIQTIAATATPEQAAALYKEILG